MRSLLLGRVVQVWQGIAPVEAGRANFPWLSSPYISLRNVYRFALEMLCSVESVWISLVPSLLAFVALVGFVVVEVVLKFGA